MAFRQYHRENPLVWDCFNRYALELVLSGKRKFSQRMIWETMRMDSMLSTKGEYYKLNNDYTKYYAEMWMLKNPTYGQVFEMRGESAIGKRAAVASTPV